MSKAIVDGIIRSSLNRNVKRFDTIARRYSGRNRPHVHTITQRDIEDTIVDNFIGAMSKIVKNTGFLYSDETTAKLKGIAKTVYMQYPASYNAKIKDKELQARKVGRSISIYQNKLDEKKLKAPIFDLGLKLIRKEFKKQLTGEKAERFEKGFRRRTQFLHTGGETAGREAVRLLGRTVSGEAAREGEEGPKSLRASGISEKNLEKNIERSLSRAGVEVSFSSAQAREAGTNVIINMLRDIEAKWSSAEKQLKNKYNKNIVVSGTVGPSTKNKPGSESTDWVNLRAEMETEIAKALGLDAEDFATKAASMPPVEKITRISTSLIIDEMMKANSENIKVRAKKDKPDGPKRSASSVKGTSRKKKTTGARPSTKKIARAATSTTRGAKPQNLLRLQALIDKKLPDTIRKNMGAPGLENRSGRFANSAKITDISSTRKGFPSIGYTYQKNPYQIFEVGRGKAPWANSDRDPRRLIERSIREIAADLAIGRFFTRRM